MAPDMPGSGDGLIDMRDLFWYDQFARLVNCPDDSVFNEFQRLDSNDNGVIDSGDYDFIVNMITGTQLKVPAKGPTPRPAGLCSMSTSTDATKVELTREHDLLESNGHRSINVLSTEGKVANKVLVPIEIDAHGDEMMFSTTLSFDPNVLTIDKANGYDNPDIRRGTGATRTQRTAVNAASAGEGHVSMLVDFSGGSGSSIARGIRQIVVLTFTIRENVAPGTVTEIGFSDTLAPRQTIDRNGDPISVDYRAGLVRVRSSDMPTVHQLLEPSDWLQVDDFQSFAIKQILGGFR